MLIKYSGNVRIQTHTYIYRYRTYVEGITNQGRTLIGQCRDVSFKCSFTGWVRVGGTFSLLMWCNPLSHMART